MKQAIIEFAEFLKSPQQSFRSNNKVWVLALCAILVFGVDICSVVLNFGYGYFRLDYPERALLSSESKYFLVHLLLVPIIEEIGFRLYLIPSKRNVLLSSITVVWLVYLMIVKVPESPIQYNIIRCMVSIPVGLLVYLCLFRILPTVKYSSLFYFSALLFGSLHFNAFVYTDISFFSVLYVLLVIILTSFVGIIFGYIRVSSGIMYSILFHFLLNFLPVMAAFDKL